MSRKQRKHFCTNCSKEIVKKDEVDKHHIIPRSRGGIDENNIVHLDTIWHQRYHRLFHNLTPKEICKLIMWVNRPGELRDYTSIIHKINELRRSSRR